MHLKLLLDISILFHCSVYIQQNQNLIVEALYHLSTFSREQFNILFFLYKFPHLFIFIFLQMSLTPRISDAIFYTEYIKYINNF